jgi:eukaryotic-like serine/threonine-protein kinase
MASVWVARLTGKHGFEKLFAIKTILPHFAQDPRFQKMFLDEARIASRIEHANVAQVLDLGEANDVLYLVMEWVDGDSLSKLSRAVRRRRGQIPIGIVLRILADTCAGLHAAHEVRGDDGEVLGVVHRDVSPQNILVTTKGNAKLIDFGVVKARGRASGETASGQLKGKIHYMAPEQALGKPVDRRADLWSIAAVAYHLLAGVPAFDGENELATLHLLTSGAEPPPLPSHVPPPLADVILGALRANPENRSPATALDLQHALERVMVRIGPMTSVADVASFASAYLVDRADARKKALDTALQASAERRRVQGILQPLENDSSSGVGPAPVEVDIALDSNDWLAHAPVGASDASSPSFGSVPSVASTATLGSAASEVARIPTRPPPPRRRVAGLVVLCALVGAIGGGLLWHHQTSVDALGSAAETTWTPAPGASPTPMPSAPQPSVSQSNAQEATPQASAEPSAGASQSKPAANSPIARPPTHVKVGPVRPPTPTTPAGPPAPKKDYGF